MFAKAFGAIYAPRPVLNFSFLVYELEHKNSENYSCTATAHIKRFFTAAIFAANSCAIFASDRCERVL